MPWHDLLRVYLHDPPDKALSIQNHRSRAARYASVACDEAVAADDLKQIGTSDMLASATERLPMPTGDDDSRRVGPADGLCLIHPLSGKSREIPSSLAIDEALVERSIREIVDSLPGQIEPQRFLALWRLWPERLARQRPELAWLPADTRTPDHTIWQHLDVTAALSAVQWGGNAAFLSFSVGPVQSFIAQARTVRDLWTGSMILSWLAFQAMLPIVEAVGPTAMVYPALRGSPLFDRWLRDERRIEEPELRHGADELKSPCLPNRFVAVVPWGTDGANAVELAKACEKAARGAWKRICDAVHVKLNDQIEKRVPDDRLRRHWDRFWSFQVEDFFDFRTAVLPWKECGDAQLADLLRGGSDFSPAFPEAAKVRQLTEAVPVGERPRYPQNSAGQWQHRLELSARLMEATRSVRRVLPSTDAREGEQVPPKCSLLGSYEQMGPAGLDESAMFWKQAVNLKIGGVRLRRRERLCALALVKRFAGAAFLWRELGLADPRELRWDDTATVAARRWLEKAGVNPRAVREDEDDWSGQWLHWPGQNAEEDEEKCPDGVWEQIQHARKKHGNPPAYYAILVLDGDYLGGWLRGERSPAVDKVMHPKMLGYYGRLLESLPQGDDHRGRIDAALKAPRHVGPALHAAISEALANFALHFVPKIVKDHAGTLIYSGGDDVLALLPTASALACAQELNATFRSDWKGDDQRRERLLMGGKATLSAGLAVVHYKEDLRLALQWARDAESAAKKGGRDALQLTVCRRSGEHATAICPWEFVPKVEHWLEAFLGQDGVPGASDRWAYHLRAELDTLVGLNPEAMRAEIRRQVQRSEKPTRLRLSRQGDPETAAEEIGAAFHEYRLLDVPDDDGGEPRRRIQCDGEALGQFITLCQSASFLARGRDV
ncbi:MAG TPA: type III-B CRISPR-associated protein Cas10/Cmr2 [Pirellulales bacterium]|nr:type III-B CRISPR-associated protein Cas10/Cmr2 [Pirellulales bacterium]